MINWKSVTNLICVRYSQFQKVTSLLQNLRFADKHGVSLQGKNCLELELRFPTEQPLHREVDAVYPTPKELGVATPAAVQESTLSNWHASWVGHPKWQKEVNIAEPWKEETKSTSLVVVPPLWACLHGPSSAFSNWKHLTITLEMECFNFNDQLSCNLIDIS